MSALVTPTRKEILQAVLTSTLNELKDQINKLDKQRTKLIEKKTELRRAKEEQKKNEAIAPYVQLKDELQAVLDKHICGAKVALYSSIYDMNVTHGFGYDPYSPHHHDQYDKHKKQLAVSISIHHQVVQMPVVIDIDCQSLDDEIFEIDRQIKELNAQRTNTTMDSILTGAVSEYLDPKAVQLLSELTDHIRNATKKVVEVKKAAKVAKK